MIREGIILREVSVEELKLDDRELSARLGCGQFCVADRLDDILPELLSVATPKYAARLVEVEYDGRYAVIDGERISSLDLVKNLCGAKRAYLMCVTLGIGVDRYLYRLGMLSGASRFIADAAASALAEALADFCERELLSDASHTPRFSVGYGDLPLGYQPSLLSRLSADATLGVTLTESLLMIPTKTITAIIGVSKLH